MVDQLMKKLSFFITTTKLMGLTQDIQHIIGKMRISAYLTSKKCYISDAVSLEEHISYDKSGKLTSTWHFFVQVEKSALEISTFLMQKNC